MHQKEPQDPRTGKIYKRLSYGIALAIHAMRLAPRFVTAAADGAADAFRSVKDAERGFKDAIVAAGPDHFDGTDAEGFPGGDARMADAGRFTVDDGTLNPEALRQFSAECSGEEIAIDTRQRMCPHCFVNMPRERTKCEACGTKLTRLRDRVRTKPLTPADIVEGGVYVPKRGNDRTPNYEVDSVDWAEGGYLSYFRSGPRVGDNEDCEICSVADFLALVSRRADA